MMRGSGDKEVVVIMNTEEVENLIRELLRLQIQERPASCMMLRGVEKQNPVFVISSLLGVFRNNDATRHAFLAIVTRPRPEV